MRKTRSEEDDIQLSADIEARGLLQNLLVTRSKKRGKFAVIAGGRRLRAIEMIVTRGAWAPDTEIECKLLEGSEEEAGEASLAENFQRVGMSPAEEDDNHFGHRKRMGRLYASTTPAFQRHPSDSCSIASRRRAGISSAPRQRRQTSAQVLSRQYVPARGGQHSRHG